MSAPAPPRSCRSTLADTGRACGGGRGRTALQCMGRGRGPGARRGRRGVHGRGVLAAWPRPDPRGAGAARRASAEPRRAGRGVRRSSTARRRGRCTPPGRRGSGACGRSGARSLRPCSPSSASSASCLLRSCGAQRSLSFSLALLRSCSVALFLSPCLCRCLSVPRSPVSPISEAPTPPATQRAALAPAAPQRGSERGAAPSTGVRRAGCDAGARADPRAGALEIVKSLVNSEKFAGIFCCKWRARDGRAAPARGRAGPRRRRARDGRRGTRRRITSRPKL